MHPWHEADGAVRNDEAGRLGLCRDMPCGEQEATGFGVRRPTSVASHARPSSPQLSGDGRAAGKEPIDSGRHDAEVED